MTDELNITSVDPETGDPDKSDAIVKVNGRVPGVGEGPWLYDDQARLTTEGPVALDELQAEVSRSTDASLGDTDLLGHPRVPRRSPAKFPTPSLPSDATLVAETDSLTNWSAGSDAAIAADTEHYKTGTQGLQVDTQGNGQVTAHYSPTLSLSLADGPLVWWVYLDDLDTFERTGCFLFDSSGDYFRLGEVRAVRQGWNRVEITQSEINDPREVSGTPDETDIVELRLILADDTTGAAQATFSHVVQKPYSGNAKVLFRLDDATSGIRDTALPTLDDYDMPATIGAPTDLVGTSGYMTWDELRNRQQQDDDIISHQTGTEDLTSTSDSESKAILYQSQAKLLDEGFVQGCRWFFPHQNTLSDSAEDIAREYYGNPVQYSTDRKYNSLPATGLPRNVRFFSFDSHSVSSMQSVVDDLEYGNDAYMVIVWHEGDGSADLDTMASYVDSAAGVEAATYSEVFDPE